jgi:D-alanyl-D-alanine carboxypeptidase
VVPLPEGAMAFDFGYPNLDNEKRGWGPGWEVGMPLWHRPATYPGSIVPLVVRGMDFGGGIRKELHDLAEMLLEESLDRGYIPRLSTACYGGAFRPTKKSSGDPNLPPGDPGSVFTTTPSPHSWCTALDINTLLNVYGGTEHQIPDAMADLWREYGWRWLGPHIEDWQHFDFAGTPEDAEAMTDKARKEGLGVALTDEQRKTLVQAEGFLSALAETLGGQDNATAIGKRVAKAVENMNNGGQATIHCSADCSCRKDGH